MLTDEHEHAMKVAKVIAKAMGDNFSDAFKNKQRWTAKKGMSGGRFRDVNEPFQDDYIAAAKAAAAVIAADRAGLVAEVERLLGVVDALLQHDASSFWGVDAEKNRRASYRGVVRKAKKARAALKDTRHDADA